MVCGFYQYFLTVTRSEPIICAMLERLPESVRYTELVALSSKIQGELPLVALKRLSEIVMSSDGVFSAVLSFDEDTGGTSIIQGSVHGQVMLQCQRCLNAVAYPLDFDFTLGIVKNELLADRLPEEYDPLIVTGSDLLLHDLVEDEIVLQLPLVASHEKQDCQPRSAFSAGVRDELKQARENPFAQLSTLKD